MIYSHSEVMVLKARIAELERIGPAFPGMSLRDWFAGKMLAGASVNNEELPGVSAWSPEHRAYWEAVARAAYMAADAMLAEREKKR